MIRHDTAEALVYPEVSEYIDDLREGVATFLSFYTPVELATHASIHPLNLSPSLIQAMSSQVGLVDYIQENVKRIDLEMFYSLADAVKDPASVMLPNAGPLPSSHQPSSSSSSSSSTSTSTSSSSHPSGGGGRRYPLEIVVYKLSEEGMAEEFDDSGEATTASHWVLPAKEFDGMWDSLIYDSSIKSNLVNYVQVAMQLADAGVDEHLVAFNRVVLLHGPPGTGKTSLCKALAHKLAIRLSSRYAHGMLLEISAHGLFSKWFSESGKLVTKLFTRIRELVADQDSFVVILIDEVESLTAARSAAAAGTEPSDSIRVVNALLTQIDLIKEYPNVAILTTSNITGAIDLAFVDRADIKQYVGLPSNPARYAILASSVSNLFSSGVVQLPVHPAPLGSSNPYFTPYDLLMESEPSVTLTSSLALLKVAQASEGLSGRSLRKLPVAALVAISSASGSPVSSELFLSSLLLAAQSEMASRHALDTPPDTAAVGTSDIPRSLRTGAGGGANGGASGGGGGGVSDMVEE